MERSVWSEDGLIGGRCGVWGNARNSCPFRSSRGVQRKKEISGIVPNNRSQLVFRLSFFLAVMNLSSSSNVSCDNCPPYGAHYCYELNEARFYYSPSYCGDEGRMFYCDYAYSRYRDPFPFLYASRVSYEPIPYCKEYPFHIPEGGVEPLPSCARSDMYKTELCKHFIRTGRCKYGSKCQFAHGYGELRRPWSVCCKQSLFTSYCHILAGLKARE